MKLVLKVGMGHWGPSVSGEVSRKSMVHDTGLIDRERKCPSHLLPVPLNMSECRVLSKWVLSLQDSGCLVTE